MRTALLVGVTGGLILAGCAGPSGTPTNAARPSRESQRTNLPAPSTTATVAEKLTAVSALESKGQIATDKVVIKFAQGTSGTDRKELLDRLGLELVNDLPAISYGVYRVPDNRTVGDVLTELWGTPAVAVAEPDYRVEANAIAIYPADPLVGQQAYLDQINVPEAWFLYPGNPRDPEIKATILAVSDVTVAVLDTGFDFTHTDLNLTPDGDPRGDGQKVYGGIDLVNGDGAATDDNGHGTLVAGIIAAITDEVAGVGNGFAAGMAGVSWNSRIIPVKVLDETGAGDISDSAEGILHAVQTWQSARGNSPAPPFQTGSDTTFFTEPFNARLVINMSYGIDIPNSLGEPQMERDAVEYAVSNGAVCVAAAGDSGKPVDDGFTTTYPAGHSSVIAVGAVDEINQPMVTSNRPKNTIPIEQQRFVVAPGANILGTQPANLGDFGVGHGTSVAAAQVSGVIALMWEFYPLLLNEDGLIPTLLESSNENIVGALGVDGDTGFGLVDALAALEGTFEPRPTNDPIVVRAFTDPVLHNVVHFVVLSKYRLMDPSEIPFFLDAGGNPTCVNNCAAFSYRIGIDVDEDGTLSDGELFPVEQDFFPNEIVIGQLNDSTYSGRIFFPQGPDPGAPCPDPADPNTPVLEGDPPTGILIIEVTGVPEDFRIDETLPKTISASTSLELTPFSNS